MSLFWADFPPRGGKYADLCRFSPETGPRGPFCSENRLRGQGSGHFPLFSAFLEKSGEKGVTCVFFQLPLPCEPVFKGLRGLNALFRRSSRPRGREKEHNWLISPRGQGGRARGPSRTVNRPRGRLTAFPLF